MKPKPKTREHVRPGRVLPAPAEKNKNDGTTVKKAIQPGFLSVRPLLLSIGLLCFFASLRNVSSYDRFFADTIDDAYEKMRMLRDMDNYMSPESRKQMRWRYSYYWVCKTKEYLRDDSDAIVLLPPNDYIKTINPNQVLPEPAVGYYYSGGLKTAWGITDYAYKCTYYYQPNTTGGPSIVTIRDRAQIDSLLQEYKSYKYSY